MSMDLNFHVNGELDTESSNWEYEHLSRREEFEGQERVTIQIKDDQNNVTVYLDPDQLLFAARAFEKAGRNLRRVMKRNEEVRNG